MPKFRILFAVALACGALCQTPETAGFRDHYARYRALGVEKADGIVWFWIGIHAEYDTLVS